MHYNTYLFDFDYTLANSEKGILICFKHVLNQNGFQNIDDDTIKRTIGLTLEEAFSILTGIHDEETVEQYRKEYVAKSDFVMTANTFLYPEAILMLKDLKKNGKKVGIISTKFRRRIQEALVLNNIVDLVDIVIGREDVVLAKPNPEGVLLAIEKLGTRIEETVYVGDCLVDSNTAMNAGIDFIGVTSGITTEKEFSNVPHIKIIKNMSELL